METTERGIYRKLAEAVNLAPQNHYCDKGHYAGTFRVDVRLYLTAEELNYLAEHTD
jgi:hypothetical protein